MRKAGGSPLAYLRITLQEIIITGVHPVYCNTMRVPREAVSLAFSRAAMDYVLQNAEGNTTGTVSSEFDIKAQYSDVITGNTRKDRMLFIDKNGMVDAKRIIVKRFSTIERGKLDKVNGIVVHQTQSPTDQSTFNSYQNSGANGAHFLISKDGTIYQTASVHKITNHVGFLQSRCLLKKSCSPQESKNVMEMDKIKPAREKSKQVHRYEARKKFPERFPYNADSIGIEIVGKSEKVNKKDVYEPVNDR